eukprot:5322449-Amphidinium_carterae.2
MTRSKRMLRCAGLCISSLASNCSLPEGFAILDNLEPKRSVISDSLQTPPSKQLQRKSSCRDSCAPVHHFLLRHIHLKLKSKHSNQVASAFNCRAGLAVGGQALAMLAKT